MFAADGKEFARLRLDAFGAVQHHDRTVDGHQRAIGVLAEILVAGRVQQVEQTAAILELQHGGGDGNPALLLDSHPVGDHLALVAPGAHAPAWSMEPA